nr:HutD family protein [Mesorhizobium shangrilense]
MRLLSAADHRTMPWKNGGGTTTEIAVSPEGAGLEDFDWRLSMARVEAGGPFSVFPAIDRSLTVLEGEGIILKVGDRASIGLLRTSDPLPFPADASTSSTLIDGPILDLNVMVRRGRFTCDVRRLMLDDAAAFASDAEIILMFCSEGRAAISLDRRFEVGPKDCLCIDGWEGSMDVEPLQHTELVVVELRAVIAQAQ